MKGILALCQQDIKRLLNNALFWVISATLVLIVLVVNFALPSQLGTRHTVVYSFNIPQYANKTLVVQSRNELEKLVMETNAIGLFGTDSGIEVIHTGVSEKVLLSLLQGLEDDTTTVKIVSLHGDKQAIPFNKRMAPVFISFEALIIGFILGGALLLSEKEEGTVNALRIAPISAWRYVISKTLLFAFLGTVYALLMAVLCVGFSFNWFQFIILSFLGSALFTLTGLCFTVFFRDMSSWFFSAALLLAVNMLTALPYSNPTLSLPIMRYIPSYPVVFAYHDILFGNGIEGLSVLIIAAWCIGVFLLSLVFCKRFFLKREVKA